MSDEQIPVKGQDPDVELELGQPGVKPEPPAEGDASDPKGEPVKDPSRANQILREITSGSAMISVLAVLLALLASAILIVLTSKDVQAASGYFFSRPADTLRAIWDAVSGAYTALFQGAIYNFRRPEFLDGIRPITETLSFATPLIAAGLGVALSFRVGLFNIGGRGQMLMAAAASAYIGFSWPLPPVIHLIVAIAGGLAAGALWGGIVGFLKARTGAHEVIVTIMLNFVAFYLISFWLRTPGALQAPGSNNPKSPAILDTAAFPDLLGPRYNLHVDFIVVIVATVFVWYLLNRSNLGFQFRAVGENPNAARVAGINVKNTYVQAMLLSGGLVGLAGVSQALGTFTTGFASGVDSNIGFDAITVALLGRSRPWGVFFAGILFGALKAGGYSMQASQGVPIDIVLVIQSLIVLFIAAPPLIRAIFRLPMPSAAQPKAPVAGKKAVVTK